MAHVKSNCEGDIRRFTLPDSPTYANLHSILSSMYPTSSFTIKYTDEDGDLVTIASDTELALALADLTSNILRITVIPAASPVRAPEASAAPHAAPAPAPSSAAGAAPSGGLAPAPAPTESSAPGVGASARREPSGSDFDVGNAPEQFLEGVAGLLGGFLPELAAGFGSFGEGGFPRGGEQPHPWRGRRGRFGHRGQRGRRGGFGVGRGRCGWGGSGAGRGFPFAGVFAAADGVNPEVVSELEALGAEVEASVSVPALMLIVPAAMPHVETFLAGGIGEEGAVPPAALDALAAGLAAAIAPHAGEPLAERVVAFVRRALADCSVLALLRQFSGASAEFTPGPPGARRAPPASASRFDVHAGVECDGCGVAPIVGTRHWCTTRPNYDLCDACIANDEVDKTGLEFREIEFPWQADGSGRQVPRPTLAIGASGVQVMMLQKILTDLGFMNPAMYRRAVGRYGEHTAAAVNKFRETYGLGIQGQFGVYDEVVEASLISLLDNNIPPSSAAGSSAGGSSSAAAGSSSDHSTLRRRAV